MSPAVRLILSATGIVLLAFSCNVSAGKNGPNKDNAKLCQKDGWQHLVGETGEVFATENECVSYAARGGRLLSETEALCLFDGYQSLATSDGNPFSGSEDCLNYVAAGQTLVYCDLPGTPGVDKFYSIPINQTACGFGGNDGAGSVEGVFYGGAGDDFIGFVGSPFNASLTGVFNGGAGNDWIFRNMTGGTFDGGDGDDHVGCRATTYQNGIWSQPLESSIDDLNKALCLAVCTGGGCLPPMTGGTFNGEAGSDSAAWMEGATFNGGDDNDFMTTLVGGTFNGNEGDDGIIWLGEYTGCSGCGLGNPTAPPVFNGGPGDDLVDEVGAHFIGVATFNGETGDDFVSLVPFNIDGSRVSLDGGEDFDTIGTVQNCSNPPSLTNFENNPCPNQP